MTPLTGRGFRRRGLRGGVAFVYFSLLALPALMFGAGMATDFTRIIQATRQVSNATQAAALAGAQQFVANSVAIDGPKAKQAAADTYCVAAANGELSRSVSGPGGAVACTSGGSAPVTVTMGGDQGNGAYLTVSVTSRYVVQGLMFTKFFGASSMLEPAPLTRTAAVCLPGIATGPTNGFCVHPRANR